MELLVAMVVELSVSNSLTLFDFLGAVVNVKPFTFSRVEFHFVNESVILSPINISLQLQDATVFR